MSKRVGEAGKAMLLSLLIFVGGMVYVFFPAPPPFPISPRANPNFLVGYTHIYLYDYNATLEQGKCVYLEGNFTLVDQENATLGVFSSNYTIVLNESSFMYVHPIANFSLFYANGFQIWGNGFMDTNPVIIHIPLNQF